MPHTPTDSNAPPTRLQKVGSVGLLLYLVLMLVETWPPPFTFPARDAVLHAVQPALQAVGMVQEWHMFVTAGPSSHNLDLTAEITFDDGSTQPWTFAHQSRVPLVDRFRLGGRYHNWRHFFFEPENAALWPDLARWLARQYRQPTRRPVLVELRRMESDVGPPPPGDLDDPYTPQPRLECTWSYRYTVRPDDP